MAKVFYSQQPDETLFIPTPDGVAVRFRENIEEIAGEDPQWSADEYSVVLRCKEALARARVENNRAAFLEAAKGNEVPKPTPMDIIQQQLDEQADALIELADIIAGGE